MAFSFALLRILHLGEEYEELAGCLDGRHVRLTDPLAPGLLKEGVGGVSTD